MKTKCLIFIGLTSLLFHANISHGQVMAGIREGVAASTFSAKGALADNDKIILSHLSGVFATVPVSKFFAIQPEINYLKKGRSNETSQLGVSTQTDFSINYLQVPLQLQYRDGTISSNGKSVFYFTGGPYVAFALDNEQSTTLGESTTVLVTKNTRDTDWGLTFGIGLQTAVKNQRVRFDLKYDMGLSEIGGQPEDFRTKCLSLSVGVVL